MGGSGASLGIYYTKDGQKHVYGEEYRTVYAYSNIKFLMPKNPKNKNTPLETMTPGRVYVTVKEDGETLKAVTYYDGYNKRSKQIDLDHFHNKMKPHVQEGYFHQGEGRKLTKREQKLLDKIYYAWYIHLNW